MKYINCTADDLMTNIYIFYDNFFGQNFKVQQVFKTINISFSQFAGGT